jgi:hypothetical protein
MNDPHVAELDQNFAAMVCISFLTENLIGFTRYGLLAW